MKLSVRQVSKSHVIEKHHLPQHHQVQPSLKFMIYFLFMAGQQTKCRRWCGFKVNTLISSNQGNRACRVLWGEPNLLKGMCQAPWLRAGNDLMESSVPAACAGFFNLYVIYITLTLQASKQASKSLGTKHLSVWMLLFCFP